MSIGVEKIDTFDSKLFKPGVAVKLEDTTDYVRVPFFAIISEVEPTRLRIHFYHNGIKGMLTNDINLAEVTNGHMKITILK